jgi:hypothetical protein
MNLSQFENKDAETVKSATAVLRRARRRYSAAVARIQRVEKFLEKQVAGLGCESEHLYGDMEPFKCPPEPVIVGLSRHLPRSYTLFFAKRDSDWHFYLAPTTSDPKGGTLIRSDEAIPLASAPAEVVLCCVETIEVRALEILEHLAVVVAVASGDEMALAQSKTIASKKLPEEDHPLTARGLGAVGHGTASRGPPAQHRSG